MFEDLKRRAAAREQAKKILDKLPFECETISEIELVKLIEVRKKMQMLAEAYDQASAKGLTPDARQEYFEQTLKHLDQFIDLWKYKFTTADQDEANTNKYSVYYVTKSGVSLRLKRINLEKKELRGTVEPFMEKIYFDHPDTREISENPIIGWTVMEYCSPEFLELQKRDVIEGSFSSKIKKYKSAGKVIRVENVKDGLEHLGHEVNKIFFENP